MNYGNLARKKHARSVPVVPQDETKISEDTRFAHPFMHEDDMHITGPAALPAGKFAEWLKAHPTVAVKP